jgi:hypothetical protein
MLRAISFSSSTGDREQSEIATGTRPMPRVIARKTCESPTAGRDYGDSMPSRRHWQYALREKGVLTPLLLFSVAARFFLAACVLSN